MSDHLIEKKFLYLVLLSVSIHVAVFALILNLPQEKKSLFTEPLIVDLDGIPSPESLKKTSPPVTRFSEDIQRFDKETAPKGDAPLEKIFPGGQLLPQPAARPAEAKRDSGQSLPVAPGRPVPSGEERSPREELFRSKSQPALPDTAFIYPGAARMARLEETYRKKYGPEVADGETRFLNTDDIQFGSFLRRFETAIYGVWRYPAEAARMGIEGITPVRITFNRRGEIISRELLQSSGSKILDTEVLRSLDQVGAVGTFPKGYEKETFKLIAFFHYGISQGAMRSLH